MSIFLVTDLERVLNDAGFATEAASSGEEALTLLQGTPRKYKALITDVCLNGTLNGWDVARYFREGEQPFPP